MCRSLSGIDGVIPPKFQAILESQISHGALNLISLKVFKHYKLGQLTSVENKRHISLPENMSKIKRFKFEKNRLLKDVVWCSKK